MTISTIYGLVRRNQSVSILGEPFQINLSTRQTSTSMVKLLMRLKASEPYTHQYLYYYNCKKCPVQSKRDDMDQRLCVRSFSYEKKKAMTSFGTFIIDFQEKLVTCKSVKNLKVDLDISQ